MPELVSELRPACRGRTDRQAAGSRLSCREQLAATPAMSEDTITLIAAIVSTIIGVGTFFHYFLAVTRWPHATGTVIGNVASRRASEGNRYAYFPRIAFKAANGKTYEVEGDIGLNDQWPIGQSVELRYRPSNPNHTTIAKGWQRLLFSTAFIGLGIACWYAWLGLSQL